jgi:hypothetical protein
MTSLIGPVLQILGIAAVSIGAFIIATWLGFIVMGGGVFAVGFVLERGG